MKRGIKIQRELCSVFSFVLNTLLPCMHTDLKINLLQNKNRAHVVDWIVFIPKLLEVIINVTEPQMHTGEGEREFQDLPHWKSLS